MLLESELLKRSIFRKVTSVGRTTRAGSLLVLQHPCQAVSARIMGHTNVSALDYCFVSISVVVTEGGEVQVRS